MTRAEQINIKIETGQCDNFYEILTDILTKVSGGNLDKTCSKFKTIFTPYMLCRYLSMKSSLSVYGEVINQLWYRNGVEILSKEQVYQLAYQLVPKQKSGYIQYIKKPEKNKEKTINNLNENVYLSSYIDSSIDDL